MIVSDKNLLKNFTEDFCNIVNSVCKYAIVSGYVAISTGRSRGTEDIDIIIEKLSFEDFKKLNNLLLDKFEVLETDDVKDMYERLNENINIRYVYKNSILPNMEVKFAKDKLDLSVLHNREKILISDVDVFFGPISSNIAFKETILTSQKDKEDTKHLREIFQNEINEDEINYFKKLILKYR